MTTYLKKSSTNNQESYQQKNDRQKIANQEKYQNNNQNDVYVTGDSKSQIASSMMYKQGFANQNNQVNKQSYSNSEQKQIVPQNENFNKLSLENQIQELQNQLKMEQAKYMELNQASDEQKKLINQLLEEQNQPQNDLKSQLESAITKIEEFQRKEKQQIQYNYQSQDYNKIKALNDDLNKKCRSLETDLETYKSYDKQQKQQIQTLTNQQSQISLQLQKTQTTLQSEQENRQQLESILQETKNSLDTSVRDFNNLQSQTYKNYKNLEQQKKQQQQFYEKKIKELEQQIKQQRANQDLESFNINLEQLKKKFQIESEKYNKLYDNFQILQKINQQQAIQIYGFEPIQLDLVCKVSEAEFKVNQLQKELTDALKQIDQKNQQIEDQKKQKCEQNSNFSENDRVENINLKNEELKNAQQKIEELLQTIHELEDENHQLKQQTLNQEKEYQEQLQIKNKKFSEIQIKFDVLKNQEVKQNKTIEDLKYQLKQKDREIEKKIKQITENFKQQYKVQSNKQTQTINQIDSHNMRTSDNQVLQNKLQDSEIIVKQLKCEKVSLISQYEDRIKKQNELVDAIRLRCQQLENKLKEIQHQLLECNKELNSKEQKIRDQELEIARLSDCHSKPYIDESKNFDIKQSQNFQTAIYEFSSNQMTQSQIQQRPFNQVQSYSKSPKVIPDFQIDLNNNKYSITLLLGKNDNGKQQIMKTLFENKQYDLYQANLEVQSQTLVINTDSFDFDNIDEREKQIKEYKKIFNKYANKQFNFWIVIPFVRTDFMKKDIMDIYKYFHKLNVQISIIVTDFHLSENQNEDETHLRSKFTLYKPREILFITKDTNKNQLISMLKSNLSKEDSNNFTQLTIKDTIFQEEDEEEQQNITKQLNRLQY